MVKMSQQIAAKPLKTVAKKMLSNRSRSDDDEIIYADFAEIDFDELARSMGAHGERVDHPDQLAPALQRCIASGQAVGRPRRRRPRRAPVGPGLRTFKKMHQEPAG